MNWESGVKKYNVEIDKNGHYDLTYEGPNTLKSYEDKKVYKEVSGQYCYRVHAISNDKDTSYSNRMCLFGDPKVLIPTAFTPNEDALNEGFNLITRFILSGELDEVNTFSLKIFNRWG